MICRKSLFLAFILGFLFVLSTQAEKSQELLGAEKTIAKIEKMIESASRERAGGIGQRLIAGLRRLIFKTEQVRSGQPINQKATAEPFQQWLSNLRQFLDQQKNLAPEQAAREWLKLFDRFISLPVESHTEEMIDIVSDSSLDLSGNPLIAVLPGPDSWPYLADSVAKRKPTEKGKEKQEIGLRLLCLLLTKQTVPLKNELEALLNKAEYPSASEKAWMQRKITVMIEMLDSPDENRAPAELVAHFEKALQLKKPGAGIPTGSLKVPDLVVLAGPKKAAELLIQTLLIPNLNLQIVEGQATLDLARKLVNENISRLPNPQWSLVQSVETTDLYEIMQNAFPPKSALVGKKNPDNDWQIKWLHENATVYYVMGLVCQGKTDKAAQTTLAMKVEEWENKSGISEIWRTVNWSPRGSAFLDFFHQVLLKEPERPFWDFYLEVAQALGQIQRPLNTLQEVLKNKKLNPAQRSFLQIQLAEIYLTMNQVEQAVPLMQAILRTEIKNEKSKAQFDEAKFETAEKLAKLGALLGQQAWVQEAAAAVMEMQTKATKDAQSYNPRFIRFLLKQKMYGEAEAIVLAQMEAVVKYQKVESEDDHSDMLFYDIQSRLSLLTEIYNEAGRFQDTILLLERAPWWSAGDLLLIEDDTVQLKAAEALHALGRDPEVLPILKHYLYGNSDDDAAYQLLLEITGPAILPWLDELYARDRFEERPLIWKAQLLKKMNRLNEAESTVRKALLVDPTDGEQPQGDRVRGYAILAEILEAKGKKKDAVFYRDVVQSVRLAEEGDDFTQAGLIQRSLEYYLKAQALFADAYCIQWRLAERLYAAGDMAGAKEHYRIAFERMPEQFGRVASFCFGCENAFGRPQSRSMAEEVLLRLAKEKSPRPQVFYLLGELRKNQNRYRESYEYYKIAALSDPDYLDAWEEMRNLFNYLLLSQAEQDRVNLRMLQLDPLQKHFWGGLMRVGDFAKFWQIIAANQKFNLAEPKELLALKAAKQIIEEQKAKGSPHSERHYRPEASVPKPGEALARLDVIRHVAGFFPLYPQREFE